MFRDPENGDLHYAKFYATPDYATFELAFLRLYEHGRLHTVDAQLVTLGPRVGIASRWRDDLQTGSVQAFSQADDEELACVYQLSVMADNADFLGWFDNIGYSVDTGRLVVIDVGASMLARSLGQIRLRPDKSVRWFAEDERYRRVLTRVTQLYDPLFARDPALAARGARNLVSFTDDVVATTFNDAGVRPQLAEEATARIRLRRDTILARYGLSHRS
ncbi:hypothetical protein [Trinickia sp.]|jgi:hypothetical protein|uniref:hypothetical protein n=1 Tax=Trinickia sp. TaxID=2571163 RepID=UPI002D806BBD|nr:hypothetical protein [Trinickia sp.]